ncbi:transposase [Pseudomonas umsongensis]|nr:transposase [Pseudomonas umsongensis]
MSRLSQRDLPRVFGCWSPIYKKFSDWSATGKRVRVFKVTAPPSTTVRAAIHT